MEYTEIVYVLKNEAMPHLVKIGRTAQADISARMSQLYNTSVPLPFDCVYAKLVKDSAELEAALHTAFGPARLNPRREFFMIDEEQVVSILKIIEGEEVTPVLASSLESNVSESERASAQRVRRPRMNYQEMGIPVGSSLTFLDGETDVEVADEHKVKYDGAITSLTAVTRKLLDNGYNIQPKAHWYFNGVLLSEIYERTYVYDE
jgi:hypothetical protein